MNVNTKSKSGGKPKGDRRNKELAMIHIGAKKIGMPDENYQQMIADIGGAASGSAKDLNAQGRQAVLDHLKMIGFRPVHKSAKASGMHIPAPEDRQPLLSKIGALLADMQLPWSYADGIAKQMFGVDRVRWLHSGQLHKVVAALIHHQKRNY